MNSIIKNILFKQKGNYMVKIEPLKPIDRELIYSRIRFENTWWISSLIDPDFSAMQKRMYFDLFFPLVKEMVPKRAVVLLGPRRVGKTVMMFHAIEALIKQKVPQQKIGFLSVDSPMYLNLGLEEMFTIIRKLTGNENPDGWYVFFDEIQFLKNWEQHLKVLVDSYPRTKFIVSGSATAALKVRSMESGAGRFTEFMLPPLTFHEYIHLQELNHLIRPSETIWNGNVNQFYTTINIQELNKHFLNYINYGGYPEVLFTDRIRDNPGRYIRNDIVDKVLMRDLPSMYGISDVHELHAFFSSLAYYSGNEYSLESLSQSSGVDKNLLKKYLEYLEAAFLIKVVHRVDDSIKSFKRTTFYKIYLTNPSLRSALFAPMEPTHELLGNMVETAIFSQWMHRDWFVPIYARWTTGRTQGEVDMIGLNERRKPIWAVEIKWSNRYVSKPNELKSLLHFCEKNDISSALVTTIDKEARVIFNGLELNFYPVALYAYVIGMNSLEQKRNKSGH